MTEIALRKKSVAFRVTVKSAVSLLLVALAVGLPQLAHAAGGAAAGAKWLPMYAPALLAGCLLGWQWGLGVGLLSPLASFAFTTAAFGNAMPAAARLPYMTIELATFGLITGSFAKKIRGNAWLAFPAVISAQLCGRTLYVVYNLIAGQSFAALWASVQTGLVGLYLQAALVPLAAVVLTAILKRRND